MDAGPQPEPERDGESVEEAAERVAAEVEGEDPPRPERTGPDGEPLGGDAS